MKKKVLRKGGYVLFFAIYLYLLSGCKKTNSSDGGLHNPPGGTACTAIKANAEDLQIFPADNAWNCKSPDKCMDRILKW